jgi:hypothetical protein
VREDHPAAGAVPRHRPRPRRAEPAGDDPLGKFGEHLPLNRQSESYAREGIDLDVSTMADWVGACAAALKPLVELIRRHVLAGQRVHGDDTTVPVLAKGKTRPAGCGPMCATIGRSPDRTRRRRSSSTRRNRSGEHPARHLAGYDGILQADAYAGFGALRWQAQTRADHRGSVLGARRRKFFVSPTSKGADGHRGGAADRCDLRHRARHQRAFGRRRLGDAPATHRAAHRRL